MIPSTLIVGAGLAGLLAADAMLQAGIPGEALGILEAHTTGFGTSSGPGFLLNPLPGRSLRPKPGYLDAFSAAHGLMQRLGLPPLPLLRPLLPEHPGSERLRRSRLEAQEICGPLLSLQHHEPQALASLCPHLQGVEGAIQVSPAFSVWPALLIEALKQRLEDAGVAFYEGVGVESLEKRGDIWALHTRPRTERAFQAERLLLTVGAALARCLPVEQVGGALVVLRPPEGVVLDCALSGAGVHIAPRTDGAWILGATYEAPGTRPLSDHDTCHQLLAKAAAFLPILQRCQLQQLWRGIRAVYPMDRMPLVGEHPQHPGLFVMGAFGSKGLLMIPWASRCLAERWLDPSRPLPSEIDLKRAPLGSWDLSF